MSPKGEHWERYELERAGERRQQQLAAHNAYGPFISELGQWDVFLTGTYDPRKRNGQVERILGVDVAPRVSRWKALRDCAKLIEFASGLVGWPVEAVLTVEPHLDWSYHLHGVGDLRGAENAVYLALRWWWIEHYGQQCQFKRPYDVADVSSYCGKHLSGPDGDLWFSPGLIAARGQAVRGFREVPVSPIPPAEPLTAGSIAHRILEVGDAVSQRRHPVPGNERALTQAFWERRRGTVSR